MIIESRDNKVFKKLKTLASKKGIVKEQSLLLAGTKIIEDYLKNHGSKGIRWICSEKDNHTSYENKTVFSASLFSELDIFGTHSPLLQIPYPEIEPTPQWNFKEPTLILCLGNPKNLGSLLRTAMAFGIEQAVLCKEACFPFLPEALRSSSGYALNFKFFEGPSVKSLHEIHPEIDEKDIVALDMGGAKLETHLKWPSPLHLLVGEEGRGVPKNFPGLRFSIPMKEPVDSLNASVAGGIGLFHWNQQK